MALMTDIEPVLKPVTDLSPKVVSMARAIDRLPPGEYSINLKKPTSKHESWDIAIDEVKRVQTMTLPQNGVKQ